LSKLQREDGYHFYTLALQAAQKQRFRNNMTDLVGRQHRPNKTVSAKQTGLQEKAKKSYKKAMKTRKLDEIM
jgi:hypothetical protein